MQALYLLFIWFWFINNCILSITENIYRLPNAECYFKWYIPEDVILLLIPNVGRQKKPPTALMCKYLSLPLKKRVGGGFLVCWGGKKKQPTFFRGFTVKSKNLTRHTNKSSLTDHNLNVCSFGFSKPCSDFFAAAVTQSRTGITIFHIIQLIYKHTHTHTHVVP